MLSFVNLHLVADAFTCTVFSQLGLDPKSLIRLDFRFLLRVYKYVFGDKIAFKYL